MKMGRNGSYVILLILATFANAEQIGNRQCPEVKTMNPFDMQKYSGTWYTIAKLPDPFTNDLICENTTLSVVSGKRYGRASDTQSSFNLLNKAYSKKFKRYVSITGTAKADDPSQPAKMTQHLDHLPGSPYWLLDTDYMSYSVLYGCRQIPLHDRRDEAWIFSRTHTMDSSKVKQLLSKVAAYGVNVSHDIVEPQNC